MNLEKMGAFILEKRKQKGLTQKELADMLHLSNRTISKWECGKGIPDSAIMMELCSILGISVNELLSGEELAGEVYKAKAEENVLALIKEPAVQNRKTVLALLGNVLAEVVIFLFIAFCCYMNIMSGTNAVDYVDIPAALIVLGAVGIVLVASGMHRDFFNVIRIRMGTKIEYSETEVTKAVYVLKVMMMTALAAGGILSVVSVINTLLTTTAENRGAMDMALAVGLLGILYGLVFCLLLLPILAGILKIKADVEADRFS